MNKYNLLDRLSDDVAVGGYDMLSNIRKEDWMNKKVVVKPVSGSGSRGVEIYEDISEVPPARFENPLLMIQEYADGPEYSVDIMVTPDGEIKAAVPRVRMRIDSGVSMTGRVENNQEIIQYVEAVVHKIGLTYMANVQVILDADKGPRLVEINPRFSGGLSLVIASGADTPLMALKSMIGADVPVVSDFKEIAMVRTFAETFVNSEELILA